MKNGYVKEYKQLIAKLNRILAIGSIKTNDEIQNQREKIVKNLYPYALQTDDKIVCIYVEPNSLEKFRIILNIEENKIVTAFAVTDYDLQSIAVQFNSIKMLLLSIYGTLDVTPAKTYFAIEQFEHNELSSMKKEALLKKFFKSQGIEPQQRQQAIRKYKEELKGKV